ncbi:MAG: type III-B CRISPR-associated protein Cas10/Cmr2 [Chloroflexi bacterium]|nr:type III-B CRISPR-associated protein Cas10/Cmr2 [Chloroflexota bacterium]
MPHLMSISIGPVQGFIAAARKTRDLWFGSMLLGEVSRAVADFLQGQHAQLIFPAPTAVAAAAPVANKLLAIVGGNPAALAKEARQAAQARIESYRQDVVQRLGDLRHEIDTDLFEKQVCELLEFASAWAPYDGQAYGDARARVERLLAGRKALRDFSTAPGRDGRLKSSLDPSRESVLLGDAPGLRARLHLKRGEQLDGISLIKRVAQPRRFVSVARVAIDPFIRRLAGQPELAQLNEWAAGLERTAAVERFETGAAAGLAHYAAFPYDTQLFYDDGQRDRDLEPIAGAGARQFYETVQTARRRLGIGEPPAYLAILQADGDHMGAAIDSLNSPAEHTALSESLARFADRADAVVRAHQGALVYSGGDDVLAFLPLDTALRCADDLRRTFVAVVGPALRGREVSLSVGLAVAHYGEHLEDLLNWARAAERAAKVPRNALAVSLHTRTAGETGTTVVHPWTVGPVANVWLRWVDGLRRDAIPDGAAYELRRLARELAALEESGANLGNLLSRETRRILARKRGEHGGRSVDPDDLGDLGAILARVGEAPASLDEVVKEIIIARRLQAAVDVAEGPVRPAAGQAG